MRGWQRNENLEENKIECCTVWTENGKEVIKWQRQGQVTAGVPERKNFGSLSRLLHCNGKNRHRLWHAAVYFTASA